MPDLRASASSATLDSRFSRWHSAGASIVLYTVITIVGTAFFFFLHYLGNQLPYDLAKQRFAEELAINNSDSDPTTFGNVRPKFSYTHCQISLTVLGGATPDDDRSPFVEAVILQIAIVNSTEYCSQLRSAADGADFVKGALKTRYWWGGKALYAIALRYISIFDIHQLIRFGTYAAYLILALALTLMGWRTALIASPIVLFGIFLSAIGYFADIENGLSYLFTLLSASVLAVMLWQKVSSRAVRICCFIAGMVSSYLWQFDGHTLLIIPLIGIVAWLGYQHLKPVERARRSAICIALFIIGFVSCFTLGQVTKAVVYEHAIVGGNNYFGGYVAKVLFEQVFYHAGRVSDETILGITEGDDAYVPSCAACGDLGWQKLPIIRDVRAFWLLMPGGMAIGMTLGMFSAIALVIAVVFAAVQNWRGNPELKWSILWMLGMMLLLLIQFVLPNDFVFRLSRFVFLLMAICWSCLILVLMHMSHRMISVIIGGFVMGLYVILAVWSINARQTVNSINNDNLVVRSNFNVHYVDDRLIYMKEKCDDSVLVPAIYLHIVPQDMTDLPEHRQEYSFDSLDFYFPEYQQPLMAGCVATVDLPDYDISTIYTGQRIPQDDIWKAGFSSRFPDSRKIVNEARRNNSKPDVEAHFDIYYYKNKLSYFKQPCYEDDRNNRFFLHVYPVNTEELSEDRQQFGFDQLNFNLLDRGGELKGACLTQVDLPDYEIREIHTGQFIAGQGAVWEVDFKVAVVDILRTIRELRRDNSTPLIESGFDIYLHENSLIYHNPSCNDDARYSRFFLHAFPVNPEDLPEERQQFASDNLDFNLFDHGGELAGQCVAQIELPDYVIASISTGQFTPEGRLWGGNASFRTNE